MKSKIKFITGILLILFLITDAIPQKNNTRSGKTGKTQIEKSDLASVAIINFSNLTGNQNYDWLKTNLPEAIYDSMKESFEFNRIAPEKVDSIAEIVTRTDGKILPEDISFIAKYTGADIIILGSYSYDTKANKILFHSLIYHLSRREITANIENSTKVDNTLFTVVDKVSEKIVKHIEIIAVEDIKRSKNRSDIIETAKIDNENNKADDEVKPSKITLKKVQTDDTVDFDRHKYDSWYMFTTGGITIGGTGEFRDLSGLNVRIGVSNSYSSFINYGGYVEAESISHDKNSEFGYDHVSLNGFLGINYPLVTDRFFIQPYVSAGYALQHIKTDSDSDYEPKSSYYNPVAGAGLRFPVRLWDIYITPFIEYSRIIDTANDFSTINAGIGIGF